MRWLSGLLVAVALAIPSVAFAGATASAQRSASPVARASAAAELRLTPALVNGPVGAIISDAAWQVNGVVSRYVPHQRVVRARPTILRNASTARCVRSSSTPGAPTT